MAKRPEDLTYKDALLALYPSKRADILAGNVYPQASWTLCPPWTKPRPTLPIDDEIERLLAKGKLRDRAEMERLRLAKCPYASARWSTAHAVLRATEEAGRVEGLACRAQALKKTTTIATKLAAGIEKFLADFRNDYVAPTTVPGTDRVDYEELNKALARSSEAVDAIRKGLAGLRAIAEMADTERQNNPPPPKNAMIWLQVFCEVLGKEWSALTGKDPAPGGDSPFARFVQAAYQSLGTEDSPDFEHQIRKMITRKKTRPYWDRFDHFEKSYDPPGTRHTTSEEHKSQREEGWKRTMLSDIECAKAGDIGCWLCLKLEYENCNDEQKKLLDEWGWPLPRPEHLPNK